MRYTAYTMKDICYWCGREIGSMVILKKRVKMIQLQLHIDHRIPFNYCQHNKRNNLVKSCHLCNLWKSGKVFDLTDEARYDEQVRYYLAKRWRSRTYELPVLTLPKRIYAKPQVAKVLQSDMQDTTLEREYKRGVSLLQPRFQCCICKEFFNESISIWVCGDTCAEQLRRKANKIN